MKCLKIICTQKDSPGFHFPYICALGIEKRNHIRLIPVEGIDKQRMRMPRSVDNNETIGINCSDVYKWMPPYDIADVFRSPALLQNNPFLTPMCVINPRHRRRRAPLATGLYFHEASLPSTGFIPHRVRADVCLNRRFLRTPKYN